MRIRVNYTLEHEQTAMQEVWKSVDDYFKVAEPDNISITDSTTMGLGLLYTGLNLKRGEEIFRTEHAIIPTVNQFTRRPCAQELHTARSRFIKICILSLKIRLSGRF
jgi:selenocysteine lyase/cysteine desulfurase